MSNETPQPYRIMYEGKVIATVYGYEASLESQREGYDIHLTKEQYEKLKEQS